MRNRMLFCVRAVENIDRVRDPRASFYWLQTMSPSDPPLENAT